MTPYAAFNHLAKAEFEEAALYYEHEAQGLGSAFVTAVEHGLQQLLVFPESGRKLLGQVRCKPIGRFPYSLLYSVQPYGIRILALMNQSRRPFYWIDRT